MRERLRSLVFTGHFMYVGPSFSPAAPASQGAGILSELLRRPHNIFWIHTRHGIAMG